MSFNKSPVYGAQVHDLPSRAPLVVRPDLLRVLLTVSFETEETAQALPVLRRTCEGLLRRARELLGDDASFRPRDLRLGGARANASAKKLLLAEDDTFLVILDGWVEVPLTPEMDFWARSTRSMELTRVCREARSDSRQSKKLPDVQFGAAEALVARPEEHREELLRRTLARIRELAALGSTRAPLEVVEITPVGAVEQSPTSLEEVGLSLSVTYRLGVLPSPGSVSAEAPRP